VLLPGMAVAADPDTPPAPVVTPSTAAQGQANQIEEIVVTAQKRAQESKDVPISISALSGDYLERAHVTGFEDLTRTVPSISFAAGGGGNGVGEGEDNIEIRGVSSSSGSATTGLYLDDTPITVNQNSGVGAVQPLAVDLARIEVLRGPQGTLYGASSEGGTVRFIQNQPKLDEFEAKVSSDLSGTMRGGVNYLEEGVVNVPVIPGMLALRGNVAYGDDSGWIDNYSLNGTLQKTGVNDVRHELLRLAAVIKPSDALTITPDVFFQRTKQSDAPVFEIQDPTFASASSFVVPPPVSSDGLYRQHFLVTQYDRDTLFVPSVTMDYATDFGDFTSISSYLYRSFDRQSDGSGYETWYIGNYLNLFTPNPQNLGVIGNIPGPDLTPSMFNTLTQEFRFASSEFDLFGMSGHAVAGIFYQDQEELDRISAPIPGISAAFQKIYGYGINSPQSPIGDPAVPTFWLDDNSAYFNSRQHTDQYSAFSQVDLDVLPDLHASFGLRYVYAREAATVYSPSHFFNTAPPDGSNYYVGVSRDYAATPKFSLMYDVSSEANVYTTIAKGYRLGGWDPEPPPTGTNNICQLDYSFLGINSPRDGFGPDSVWSYEMGSKMRLLNNSLSLDFAGFDIEWSHIQQSFILPFCGFPYTLNVGSARSYGGEASLTYKPSVVPGLTVGLTGNLTHAAITSTNSPTIVAVGQDVLFVPQYMLTVSGEYRWQVGDDVVAFVRGDFDMTGRSHGSYITINPGFVNHPYGVLNGSIGIITDDFEADLYAKNLANDHTFIQTPSLNLQATGYTVRPLTVGVTLTKNF
jgi:outer membrane receptor protein involved in Fe transport